MLQTIITSKARIRLLFKFFLNPGVKAYLRGLATEFDESTNAIRVELNRLVDAKLLKVEKDGRNKFYSANTNHPLFPEINSICHKSAGLNFVFKTASTAASSQPNPIPLITSALVTFPDSSTKASTITFPSTLALLAISG